MITGAEPIVTTISKPELYELLPHAGAMCLLDQVLHWDDLGIRCLGESHRDPRNPLRSGGRLAALHAFEYAAQAVAVHGGLRARTTGERIRPAFLAALKNGLLTVDRLDDIAGPLQVSASRRLTTGAGHIYDASVHTGSRLLARVRVVVVGQQVDGAHDRG